ncbi:hypothetical protein KAR91_81590 [Candidatus Pacearchaeota archaeon]|nr:hypothetical protein [Candidatus Pacearchaeota archaeon]
MIKYVCDVCGMEEERTEQNKNSIVDKVVVTYFQIGDFPVTYQLCHNCYKEVEDKADELFYDVHDKLNEWIKEPNGKWRKNAKTKKD